MQRYMGSPVLAQVLLERQRQIHAEGFSASHDDEHTGGQLAVAAACYAVGDRFVNKFWPWSASWWKPKDRRSDLIRAAALIVAELERLDRLKGAPGPEEPSRFMGLEVMKIEPGDRFVLRVPQRLSADQREHIRAAWQQFAADTPVVIMDGGMSLEVLRRVEDASCGKAESVSTAPP